MRFTKAHGTGNDFVVIGDLEDSWKPNETFVREVCDRHFGVGADGVIRIARSGDAFFMDYWNADGTTAEMCGNGVRVVARWLVERGEISGDVVKVDTRGGLREVGLIRNRDGNVDAFRVDMGAPILEAGSIPVRAEDPLHVPISTNGFQIDAACVSMGNPHAVLFVDEIAALPFEQLGPAIETDPLFPAKTNVEFVEVLSDAHLKVRVWERGVGETLACGTGACAVGVAAALRGATGRDVQVELRGGILRIEWGDETVHMTGPAVEVFEGELPESLTSLL